MPPQNNSKEAASKCLSLLRRRLPLFSTKIIPVVLSWYYSSLYGHGDVRIRSLSLAAKPISSLAAARVKEALFPPSQVEILFDNACASRFCCLHDENCRFCFIVFESFHFENRLRFDTASLENATRFRRCRVNKRRIRKEKFAFLRISAESVTV